MEALGSEPFLHRLLEAFDSALGLRVVGVAVLLGDAFQVLVLAALFTIGCDKLIGPDEAALAGEERDEIEAARRESLT